MIFIILIIVYLIQFTIKFNFTQAAFIVILIIIIVIIIAEFVVKLEKVVNLMDLFN